MKGTYKFLTILMVISILLAVVDTTPAYADEVAPEVTATEIVVETEGEVEAIESALIEEQVAEQAPAPVEEETEVQSQNEAPVVIASSTPTPNQILGLEEPAQPEAQSIEQGEVAEANVEIQEGQSAEVQVEMVESQCSDGEIVCVPNPDVTEVIVEILVNDEAEEALEDMIEQAEDGTPIETFDFEVDVSQRYDVEVGDYITIYNERTGSTIIAVVTDCRLGIYISVDPLVVVSSDGEVIEEAHIYEDESFLDITVPDGETVTVTIEIPGRREDPVTITVTGICQSCSVVTQTATNTATQTATATNTATATSTATSTVTATNTVTQTATATNTATATATSVQVCDDEDAENYGDPMPCIYPTNTSTPTVTSTPVTETPTGTATASQTPVITTSPEKDEENGEKKEKTIQVQNTGFCQPVEKIVVTYLRFNSADNWLLNTDLGGQFNTSTDLEGYATDPSFNPMNPCIEFVFNWSLANDDVPQIWIWDGSNHPILDADKNPILGYSPDWSSTNKIAYVSGGQIWIVSPDGTNQFNTGLYGSEPEWSPDGEVLFFVSLSGTISAVETIDWLHIPASEVAMRAPVVTADQKMVCGNSNEGCLMLTNENNPGINDQLYGEWTGIAPQPRGDKVLIVNEMTLEVRPTGETLMAANGIWFGSISDWFTIDKDEYVPIDEDPVTQITTQNYAMK